MFVRFFLTSTKGKQWSDPSPQQVAQFELPFIPHKNQKSFFVNPVVAHEPIEYKKEQTAFT